MKYLDERIYATVSGFRITSAGMYEYFILDTADTSTNLFVGNLYLPANTTSKTVDVTDIARNYLASKNKIVQLQVGIGIGQVLYKGNTDYIVPIYRYPNAKADDNKYNFDDYNTFLVSGKQSVKNFNYSSSLLPTYPQKVTDKIKIDYLVGAAKKSGTDSYTFDYGPTQTVSKTLTSVPTLYNLSYPLAEGSATDVNPLYNLANYDTITGAAPTISAPTFNNKTYLNYQYVTTVPASEVNWQFANGESNYDNPSTYPYSLTISDSEYNKEEDAYICDFYVADTDYNIIINTFPAISVGTYNCEVMCSIREAFETHDCRGISWTDWKYTNNYYTTEAYNGLEVGTTLISVRFTDGSGSYVVEVDETLPSEGVTFEWDQTQTSDIQSAKIYFDGTSYETSIPLELVNNQSGGAQNNKNLVFTITKDDSGFPIVYVNHSVYTININYNATLTQSNIVPLADDIVAYTSNRYSYRYKTDSNFKLKKLWGDIEVADTEMRTEYQTDAEVLSRFLVRLNDSNGVCIYTFPLSMTSKTQNIRIPQGLIKGSNIQIDYLPDYDYYTGAFSIEPTNPLSNYYHYTYINFTLDANGILTIKPYKGSSNNLFACYQDISTKIGQFGCPSGYYLIWKDRLGSQQIQPFQKVDTYSEDIEGSEITNYWGKRSLYKVEVQPKWKVQTGWISDEAYRCYESLFVSPTLQLYDADSDILYDVILKSRSYTEKTYLNQGKMFNLQIELEQTEKQSILY